MSAHRVFDEGTYRIEVSQDGLTATLHAAAGVTLVVADVKTRAKDLGIADFIETDLAEAIKAKKNAPLAVVVARGKAAVDERPAKVDFRVPVANAVTGLIAKITPGVTIATVIPSPAGTDGRDVFGAAIPFKHAPAFVAGNGVTFNKIAFTASIAGNLSMTDGVISVHPLHEIAGDCDPTRTAQNLDGDVTIKGSIRDGSSLHAKGCLVVGGAIEAASFKVDAWAIVKGGVVGREKGIGIVAGNFACRFTSHARLTVGGDMHVVGEVANSHVGCSGRLTIAGGSVYGGEVTANGGITCHTLGNTAGATTIVEAGSDQVVRAMILEARTDLDVRRKRVDDIRSKIAPLMQNSKRLTPAQKEKAIELLYEADEMETEINGRSAGLAERCRASLASSLPEILVSDVIHPGVILRFPGVEAIVDTAIQGPIRIIPRRTGNTWAVTLEEEGRASCALPSTPTADHFSAFVERVAQGKQAA